jgi:hypothetical protein
VSGRLLAAAGRSWGHCVLTGVTHAAAAQGAGHRGRCRQHAPTPLPPPAHTTHAHTTHAHPHTGTLTHPQTHTHTIPNSVINTIQTSDIRNLFNPENIFISKEGGGAGNNWASGFSQGEAVQDTLLDMIGEGGGKRGAGARRRMRVHVYVHACVDA